MDDRTSARSVDTSTALTEWQSVDRRAERRKIGVRRKASPPGEPRSAVNSQNVV